MVYTAYRVANEDLKELPERDAFVFLEVTRIQTSSLIKGLVEHDDEVVKRLFETIAELVAGLLGLMVKITDSSSNNIKDIIKSAIEAR